MNNELAAFEGFKFKLGDIVTLIVEGQHGERGIVVERHLEQASAGFTRWYIISSTTTSGARQEMELELWTRPIRM